MAWASSGSCSSWAELEASGRGREVVRSLDRDRLGQDPLDGLPSVQVPCPLDEALADHDLLAPLKASVELGPSEVDSATAYFAYLASLTAEEADQVDPVGY